MKTLEKIKNGNKVLNYPYTIHYRYLPNAPYSIALCNTPNANWNTKHIYEVTCKNCLKIIKNLGWE